MAFYERLSSACGSCRACARPAPRALPLGSTIGDFGLIVDGYVPPPGTSAKGDWQIVTDGYLEAMGERVVRGRGITAADTTDAQLVALINEEMARRLLAGPRSDRRAHQDRRRSRSGPGSPSSASSPTCGTTASPTPSRRSSTCRTRSGTSRPAIPIRSMTLVVEGVSRSADARRAGPAGDPRLDPNLPVADVRTMDDVVGATLSTPRFTGMLLGLRRARVGALGDRHLRRAVVPGQPAHARDRHPRRDRRRPRAGAAPGARQRAHARADRRRDRHGWRSAWRG